MIRKRFGDQGLGDRPHVAMKSENIGSTRKNGLDGAIPLRSLSVNQGKPEFTNLFSNRPDASLIAGSEPAHLGDDQRVIKNMGKDLGRALEWLLGDTDHMNLNLLGKTRHPLK